MRIDPVSGKLIINNKVMNSIQDLRNEHRKLVGQIRCRDVLKAINNLTKNQ